MPTPKAGYYTRDGNRVPGVTTVLGRFKEAGGLIHWSWDLAFKPLMRARSIIERVTVGKFGMHELEAFLAEPVSEWDYKAKRGKFADAGSVAHDMVECFIRGREFDGHQYEKHLVEMALPAFEAFQEWAGSTKFSVIETEVALVSEEHKFGGTRDAIMVNGRRALGDWKTSNKIYPEYLCQLAAYGLLDEEQGHKIDGGYHLLRFAKQASPDDPVQFTHHYWSQLDVARDAFLAMRSLYDVMKRLEKMAA